MQFQSKFPSSVYPGQPICPLLHGEERDDQELVYKFEPGPGTIIQTYNVNQQPVEAITATLLGKVVFQESTKRNDTEEAPSSKRLILTFTVSVLNKKKTEDSVQSAVHVDNDFANHLPKEGDIVLTRITRISLLRATAEILAVENRLSPVDSGIGSKGTSSLAQGSGNIGFSISQASSDLGETFRGIIRSQDVRATERDQVKMNDCFRPGDIVRAQVISLGDGSNYYLSTARNDLGVVFARASRGAGGLMYAIDWQTMVAPSTGVTELRKCAKPC